MKAPQERKTAKKIPHHERSGYPTLKLTGSDTSLTVTEIINGGRNHSVKLRNREEIELLRDFCNAWLEHNSEEK